jgi:hypothetical protein
MKKVIELDCLNMVVLKVKDTTVICGCILKGKILRKVEILKDQLEKVSFLYDL